MAVLSEEVKRKWDTLFDTLSIYVKRIPNSGRAEPALTVNEAAEVINVSTRTIRSWIKVDILPAFRIGGVIRIPSNAIQSLLDAAK
jgi:excisionase family DNA binding protein